MPRTTQRTPRTRAPMTATAVIALESTVARMPMVMPYSSDRVTSTREEVFGFIPANHGPDAAAGQPSTGGVRRPSTGGCGDRAGRAGCTREWGAGRGPGCLAARAGMVACPLRGAGRAGRGADPG